MNIASTLAECAALAVEVGKLIEAAIASNDPTKVRSVRERIPAQFHVEKVAADGLAMAEALEAGTKPHQIGQ